MQVHYQFNGEDFVARGDGPMSDVVARSAARRIDGASLIMWPGNERVQYRAQWYDDVREVYCEAPVLIEAEVMR